MESIKSVSENPFFKNYGIKLNVPSASRRNNRLSYTSEQQDNHHSFKDTSSSTKNDEDDIVEYHPVSGFVNKLLDKFSSLSTKEEHPLPRSHLKRFSSLDHLSVDNEQTTDKLKLSSGTSSTLERPSKLTTYKAKSIENLTNALHKPQQYSLYEVSLRNSEQNVDNHKELVSTKLHKDNNLARHDIIIIENTPSIAIRGSKNDETSCENSLIDAGSNYDNVLKDEMPKPNTVLTVRTIFENASQTDLYLQRRKSDQLSPSSPSFKAALLPLQTGLSTSGQNGVSKQNSLQNLSPTSPRYGNETFSKPFLLPNSSTSKRQFDNSKSPTDSHSRPEDVRVLTSSSPLSPGTNYSETVISSKENVNSLSLSDANSPQTIDNRSQGLAGVKLVASTNSSSIQQSSSRSTVSVRPTVNYKQNARVKAVPLTVPASSTVTYQKSRPVVSVAPYREKLDNDKNMENSANTFTDPREDKLQLKNHDKIINLSVENKDEEIKDINDVILPKEAKKIFEKDVTIKAATTKHNKAQSHERKSAIENSRNAENNINNKIATSTIEIKNTNTSIADKEHPLLGETLNNTEKEFGIKLVAESSKIITRPKRMAPEPPGYTQTKSEVAPSTASSKKHMEEDKKNNKGSSLGIITNGDSQPLSPRDITPPSKRSHSNETQTVNEPPPKKAIEEESESQDQPIKGIPSIIAQRLKQSNLNPSHSTSDSVSSANTSASTNPNPYSQIKLTPAGAKRTSADNVVKDALSSEIENEITAVRRKMEANRKSGGPAQIFDSSQLTKKKKNMKESSGDFVPPLDLSAITDEIMEYQPQMTKFQPCNIIFIGENVKTSRSLLDKKRKVKINIHFNDEKTETFEYPSEEMALEEYLEDHPHEREEIVVLDERNGDSTESSDDMEIDIYLSSPTKDGLLTANTSLSHSESFQSYRGRYQEEYQFGAALVDHRQVVVDPEPAVNPDKQMLRPADEDDTNTWSTNDSSDLLF